jgi:hypothetical protein
MILNCIHLHVRVRARAVYVVVGMLFISPIHYCVGACVQGIKPPTFAHPNEPHAQEAGIAVCSPPSNHVKRIAIGNGHYNQYLKIKKRACMHI